MDSTPKILQWTSKLLEKWCRPDWVEGILGDLEESYFENADHRGKWKATLIHCLQVIGFLRPRFKKKSQPSNFEAMFRNYFTAAIRNLKRHKFYAAINMLGLVIGMTAGFMILQYAYFELTYDDFFENKENIYRVQTNRYNNGELTTQWAAGCAGVGRHMHEDFPEVKDFVVMHSSGASIEYKKRYFEPKSPYYASANFFEMFSIPLLRGVDSTVLKEPWTVAISESLAKTIFGDEDPIGKTVVQSDLRDFMVTGVFQDFPERSHMDFDLIYSFETYVILSGEEARTAWQWDGFLNYVELHPDTDLEAFTAKFPDWIIQREGEELANYNAGMEFVLQPLTKIHLISDYIAEIKPTGNEKTTYFLLIIGLFVLIIAWINYINLTTARAMSRAKEVGIRKVLGSYRRQLIAQFMFESLLLNILAFVLSAALVFLTFPYFNDFVGRSSAFTWPDANWFWAGLVFVFVAGFILSGFYPSFVLSSFKPVKVLKGKFTGSASGNNLRRGLVTFQFLASVVLITGTYVVYKQMNWLQNQEIGVDIEQKMIISTPGFGSDSVRRIKDSYFKDLLSNNPAVKSFSASSEVPGRKVGWNAGGIRLLTQAETESNQYRVIACDDQYGELYGLEVIEGRGFDKSFGSEELNILLNEAALNVMGLPDPQAAINQKVYFWGDTFNIVGVVKNYRQESPKKAFDPLVFRYFDAPTGYYSVNISTSNMRDVVAQLEESWDKAFGNKVFDFFFLDDYYNKQYEADMKFGSIFGMFAALAIFVACLGLFGLASFITAMRAKEVGVRKVLGASMRELLALLTWDFAKLVLISIVIALPLSWWLMRNWLDDFENRIGLGVDVFVIPAVLILIIAIGTVAFHTFKTARLNPADTLHDE